eukprot:3862065-Prorocentrum_lima.AAC.1
MLIAVSCWPAKAQLLAWLRLRWRRVLIECSCKVPYQVGMAIGPQLTVEMATFLCACCVHRSHR